MQFEVEKRAALNKEQLRELKKFLAKNSNVKKEYHRFTFVYLHRHDFTPDPDYPIDLKVRITNGVGELSLKYGDWHGSASREEYGLTFDVEQIAEVLGMVKRLEHAWGIVTYMHRIEYDHEGMTVTIDDYYDFDHDLVEVEALAGSKEELEKLEGKIDSFLQGQELIPLTSEGMQELVKNMNAREDWRFDFTKQDIQEFIEKRKDFILCKK